MAAKRVTHLLHAWPLRAAWPPDAQRAEVAHVVVHVRGGARLAEEIAELKARGLTKVLVVPVGVGNDAEWWA